MSTPPSRAMPAPAASPPAGTRSPADLPAPAIPELALLPADLRRSAAEEEGRAAAKLAAVCEEFPGYRIWREIIGDRTRYIARSLRPGTRPHTLVTADLDELRDTLRTARPAPASLP
jgi:hypothetical protein